MSVLQALPRPTKTYHFKTYDRISPSASKLDGKGKTVLITGGSEGIGLSIAKSFAEAGVAKIIIVSRSAGPQAEAKKTLNTAFPDVDVQTIALSITDLPGVSQMMRDVGPIDVLVLNAAVSHKHVPSREIPLADYEYTFNGNVIAPLHMVQEYFKLPAPKSGARTLINISSASAHLTAPGQSGYGPSKAAFSQILQHLAGEHSPETDGVRLFSIHPGVFLTNLAKQVGTPQGAWEWEDLALPGHFAVWLAGPESTFLHGRFVWPHWDVDELIELKERVEKEPSFLQLGLIM